MMLPEIYYHKTREELLDDIITLNTVIDVFQMRIADLETKIAIANSKNDELEEAQRWIPVTERLPEDRCIVLLFDSMDRVVTTGWGWHIGSAPQWATVFGTYYHGDKYSWITHWRPLPPPPDYDKVQGEE